MKYPNTLFQFLRPPYNVWAWGLDFGPWHQPGADFNFRIRLPNVGTSLRNPDPMTHKNTRIHIRDLVQTRFLNQVPTVLHSSTASKSPESDAI